MTDLENSRVDSAASCKSYDPSQPYPRCCQQRKDPVLENGRNNCAPLYRAKLCFYNFWCPLDPSDLTWWSGVALKERYTYRINEDFGKFDGVSINRRSS